MQIAAWRAECVGLRKEEKGNKSLTSKEKRAENSIHLRPDLLLGGRDYPKKERKDMSANLGEKETQRRRSVWR